MRAYIFQVQYGGLGDHLFYSPLPRLIKQCGIADKVYISNQSRFRSAETYDLVWKTNPYLDGRTDSLPTVANGVTPSVNKIINIALAQHGIDLEREANPEIYLPDNTVEKYAGNHYIDFNYTSYTGAFTLFDTLKILKRFPDSIMVNPQKHLLALTKNRYIRTTSLSDYATLIKSAASFSALASGGATLSLAMGRPCTMYYGYGHNQIFRHSLNLNTQVGNDGVARKLISRILIERNKFRIKYSRTG